MDIVVAIESAHRRLLLFASRSFCYRNEINKIQDTSNGKVFK